MFYVKLIIIKTVFKDKNPMNTIVNTCVACNMAVKHVVIMHLKVTRKCWCFFLINVLNRVL